MVDGPIPFIEYPWLVRKLEGLMCPESGLSFKVEIREMRENA